MEKAAIVNAIAKGVIIVCFRMVLKAKKAWLIQVRMNRSSRFGRRVTAWVGEWTVADGGMVSMCLILLTPELFNITDFSSRELAGQDLDVVAPGSWIVGSYQVNSGQLGYYYLGGTSMASPHVAGVVALMAQKNPALSAYEAEEILTGSAIPLGTGPRDIIDPTYGLIPITWGTDATGSGIINAAGALSVTP